MLLQVLHALDYVEENVCQLIRPCDKEWYIEVLGVRQIGWFSFSQWFLLVLRLRNNGWK